MTNQRNHCSVSIHLIATVVAIIAAIGVTAAGAGRDKSGTRGVQRKGLDSQVLCDELLTEPRSLRPDKPGLYGEPAASDTGQLGR